MNSEGGAPRVPRQTVTAKAPGHTPVFGDEGPTMPLGVEGFTYADLYDPAQLRDLHDRFDRWFLSTSPESHARFEKYRTSKGEGMPKIEISETLLAAAPYVGSFVGKLF